MPALALECAARNDIGRRANNEDAVFTSSRLAAVADGVGGAAVGEVASGRIVDSLASLDKSRLEIPSTPPSRTRSPSATSRSASSPAPAPTWRA